MQRERDLGWIRFCCNHHLLNSSHKRKKKGFIGGAFFCGAMLDHCFLSAGGMGAFGDRYSAMWGDDVYQLIIS